jgi:hypothetical protein
MRPIRIRILLFEFCFLQVSLVPHDDSSSCQSALGQAPTAMTVASITIRNVESVMPHLTAIEPRRHFTIFHDVSDVTSCHYSIRNSGSEISNIPYINH